MLHGPRADGEPPRAAGRLPGDRGDGHGRAGRGPGAARQARERRFQPKTLGGDKNYDTRDCVDDMRERRVTPHVAQNTSAAERDRRADHPPPRLRRQPADPEAGRARSPHRPAHGVAVEDGRVTDLHPRDRLLVARAWATFLGLGLGLHDARATRRALTRAWRSTAAAPTGRRPPTPQPARDSRCSIGLFAPRWLARTAAPFRAAASPTSVPLPGPPARAKLSLIAIPIAQTVRA